MLLPVLIILFAALIFVVPRQMKAWAALASVCLMMAVVVPVAVGALAEGKVAAIPLYSDRIFGIQFAAINNLSSMFILLASVASIASLIYSKGYIDACGEGKNPTAVSIHYFAFTALCGSILGVLTMVDAFGFLFSWEVMSLSSFVMMLFHAGDAKVRSAAMHYIVVMHVGFVFILAGFVMLTRAGFDASFYSLGAYFAANNPIPLFVVFLAGFGIKAGIFPLHGWVPVADPAAPAHASAMMSAVMSKMGIYGVLRVVLNVDSSLMTIGITLFVVGAVTGLWGALLASAQNEMRRLLAYSSIENIGIIFLAMGVGVLGRAFDSGMLMMCGFGGALLHAVNHSLFKTLLFFGAGNVLTQTGTTEMNRLGGVAKRMPATAILMLAGVLAICAMPPLNGFVSEFMIYFGLIDNIASSGNGVLFSICGVIVLSLVGGLVVLAFCKFYGISMLCMPRSELVGRAVEVDAFRLVGSVIPLALMILVGLFPQLFVSVIRVIVLDLVAIEEWSITGGGVASAAGGVMNAVWIFAGVIAALALLRVWFAKRRKTSYSPTWGCGFTAVNSSMQYTGESFSEGLKGVAVSVTKSSETGDAVSKDEIFPAPHSYSVEREDKVESITTGWWMEFMRVVNKRIMKMRTGKVNNYVLYALMFLVLIFVLTLLGVI